MISLKKLMVLEKILLECDMKVKFELDFNNAYKLYTYLRDIGRITDYAFLLQDQFAKKFNDNDKLKEYHNKIMDSEIDFNTLGIENFIDNVDEKTKNEEFRNIVHKYAYWL